MSPHEIYLRAVAIFRTVHGAGDAGSEHEFNLLNTNDCAGWIKLAEKIVSSEIKTGARVIELTNQNSDLTRLNGKYFKALKEIEGIKGNPPFQVARTIAAKATT